MVVTYKLTCLILCVFNNCAEFSRPRSLLVFVNPVAGRGRSTRIYREKVASLFELARVATEVIVTEKRHHAQNVLQEVDLEQFDGLVSSAFVYRTVVIQLRRDVYHL